MRQRPGGGQVLPGQRTGPGSTRQINGIGGVTGHAGCMSERSTGKQGDQPGSEVRDEIAAVVRRARQAARAIEHYSQEQVDELVTAVAWAVVRKDHADRLGDLHQPGRRALLHHPDGAQPGHVGQLAGHPPSIRRSPGYRSGLAGTKWPSRLDLPEQWNRPGAASGLLA